MMTALVARWKQLYKLDMAYAKQERKEGKIDVYHFFPISKDVEEAAVPTGKNEYIRNAHSLTEGSVFRLLTNQ